MGNETAMGGRVDAAEAAGFVSDVDLNRVSSGATFKATWLFTNRGTTTWGSQYRLAYTLTPHAETANNPRSPMAAQSSWAITDIGAPAEVRPGETMSLTLALTAPTEPGTHATNWQLQAPDGQRFGPI